MTQPVQSAASPLCDRCQRSTRPSQASGLLHLRFPTPHTQAKVVRLLESLHEPVTVCNGVVTIPFAGQDAIALFPKFTQLLTPLEQEDVKVLFQPHGKKMDLPDYFAVEPLNRFCSRYQSVWLIDVLEGRQLFSLFQPIVEAQSLNVFAYECLLRGRQGDQVISPGQLFEAAKNAGMVFQLDVAARFAAIRGAAEYGIQQKIFVNFLPNSIYDPQNCLRSTMNLLEHLGLNCHQVVFEVVESDRVTDINHLRKILDFYRREGFEVALDDLGSGYSSLNLLHELRPSYVKLDMGLVQNVSGDRYKGLIAEKLIETAHLLEVKVIAEGIECQEDYEWLRQRQVNYVQGYYFARPAVPPPF
ncbi:MAG: EAL domain-containing protein [Synechococcales bacterium]|nr:EAL domain-containing protein [Synechococcales bacterium]